MLAKLIRDNGGITYDPISGRPVESTGYALSLHPECEQRIPLAEFDDSAIDSYFQDIAGYIAAGSYLGAWIDDGTVYLDVADIIGRDVPLAYVLLMARAYGQLAIFDMASMASIETGVR